jgi:hypothetical protein
MSDNGNGNRRSSRNETPEERYDKFLQKHEDRMRKVDETLDAVKDRAARVGGRIRKKRAGV